MVLISAQHIELLNSRCDVVVGSRSANLVPSVCWGMGGHVHDDGRRITVWLARAQAGVVLDDIAATGAIAAVFNEPFTSIAVQIKGSDARIRDAQDHDQRILGRHLSNMIHEVGRVGFDEPFVRTVFDLPLQALAAIEFSVDSLFQQTPGPRAGDPIGSAT